MTHADQQSPSPQALQQGYERSEVSVRGLMIFLVIFLVSAVVIHAGVWILAEYYLAQPRAADVVTSAATPPERFPPPNLQPIEKHNELPWQDLADLRREKGLIFDELGWTTDPTTRQPRIPDDIVNKLATQRSMSSALPPSPGTPGEGRGGDLAAQDSKAIAAPPPPQPSPGVTGEGDNGSPVGGNIASKNSGQGGQP